MVIAGEHEGIDEDPGFAAGRHLFERLLQDHRIEAKRIFIDAAVGQSDGGRFSVGDHHDLPHVSFFRHQDPPRKPQSFACVGVIWTNDNAGQLFQGDLFGRIVEQHQPQRIAGVLRPDEMRER